jgi:hypothetical protein
MVISDHAKALAVSRRLFTVETRVHPSSGHVGFVVDRRTPRQVFSKYFLSSSQSFHQFFRTHHHLLSVAATIGEIVTDVPSALSFVPSNKLYCKIMQKPPSVMNISS